MINFKLECLQRISAIAPAPKPRKCLVRSGNERVGSVCWGLRAGNCSVWFLGQTYVWHWRIQKVSVCINLRSMQACNCVVNLKRCACDFATLGCATLETNMRKNISSGTGMNVSPYSGRRNVKAQDGWFLIRCSSNTRSSLQCPW